MSETMELMTPEEPKVDIAEVSEKEIEELPAVEVKKHDFIEITSNWKVAGGKKLSDTITTVFHNDFSGSMPLDEVATSTTSLELIPDAEHEACTIDIKLTNNQRIARIGVSSEASVLEVFKEYQEYATTIFSEFIDEFEGCTVYLGGVVFDRPTPEASIKFTRIKNDRSSIYLYGIRLVLEESTSPPKSSDQLDFGMISDFLKLSIDPRKKSNESPISNTGQTFSKPLVLRDSGVTEYFEKLMAIPLQKARKNDNSSRKAETHLANGKISNNNDSPDEVVTNFHQLGNGNSGINVNVEVLIDEKLKAMEARLMDRIEQVEKNTNKTLNEILKKLEDLKK